MNRVWESGRHKGSTLLLLLALADHAADDGYCWPNVTTLADKIRMNERTVRRMIDELEQASDLYVIRTHRNHRYVVRLGMTDAQLSDSLESHGEQLIADNLSTVEGAATVDILSPIVDILSETVDNLPGHSGHPCPPNLHEPSYNHQENTAPPGADSWPTDSHLEPRPPGEQKPSIMEQHDPLSMMAEVHRRTGGVPSWTEVGPGGANPYEAEPVKALCDLLHLADLPPKQRKKWGKKLEQIAETWGGSPAVVGAAIRALPGSEYNWRTWTSPFERGFDDTLGVLITRVLTGEVTASNVIKV